MHGKTNINQEELLILTYMHEHGPGCGPQFKMDPAKIAAALSLDERQFRRCASYLSEHGLIGIHTINTTGRGDGPEGSFILLTVYLKGFGEEYMRTLEAEPSVAKKMTVALVKELWNLGTSTFEDVVAQTLTKMLKL